jgi:hypothetical protein
VPQANERSGPGGQFRHLYKHLPDQQHATIHAFNLNTAFPY